MLCETEIGASCRTRPLWKQDDRQAVRDDWRMGASDFKWGLGEDKSRNWGQRISKLDLCDGELKSPPKIGLPS